MMHYTTKAGERLDTICFEVYGSSHKTVEQVLAVNAGLAQYGPILPAGVTLELPELSKPHQVENLISLWS
ncbi:tail protein X [Algicola sagamiensis]|uniref:tail protein X n=1 Tax=Algicola sagamiensis TaxID=163869 RepID=UPI0003A1C3F3|nr:tail protein X [Algicola sagamiensis]